MQKLQSKNAFNCSLNWFAAIFGLFIPGCGHAIKGHYSTAFYFQSICYICLFLYSWTRWITTLTGFLLFISTIGALHFISFILAFLNSNNANRARKPYLASLLFPLAFSVIFVAVFVIKPKLLGFQIYKIPTESMSPAINIGDIIMVDTWIYDQKQPAIGDIIVFFSPFETDKPLIKRVHKHETRSALEATRDVYYVLGDNSKHSTDSRYFGNIERSQIIGKAIFRLGNIEHFSIGDYKSKLLY